MFARRLSVFMSGGALATAAAIVLIFGSACKNGVDARPEQFVHFGIDARGTKVIPLPAPADTSARASATLNSETLGYTYTVRVAPAGAIDSIALYQVPPGDPLPVSATTILCAGAAACAATSGTAMVVPPATAAMIATSMRAFGMQLVFFTTTAQWVAGGAMRGTVYLNPL